MADLIDRQVAIDALDALCDRECEYSKKQRNVMCGACHLGSAFDVIEQLQTAQPERKKGKWKRRLVDSGYNVDWYCSVCNWKTSLEQHGYNYCPKCGADMRGE